VPRGPPGDTRTVLRLHRECVRQGGWASWSPPASLERRVFPLGTALPARVSQPFGAVQCRLEHKPAADLPARGERGTGMCWTEDSSLELKERSRALRCCEESDYRTKGPHCGHSWILDEEFRCRRNIDVYRERLEHEVCVEGCAEGPQTSTARARRRPHPSLRAAAVVIDSHHVQSEHEVRVEGCAEGPQVLPSGTRETTTRAPSAGSLWASRNFVATCSTSSSRAAGAGLPREGAAGHATS
jgi:hypothetical protein